MSEPKATQALSYHEQVMQPAPGRWGIWTQQPPGPDGAANRAQSLLIFLNAGALHRVGPSRIAVRLARQLVKQIDSYRFDLAGIGDSPGGADLSAEAFGVADLRLVIDWFKVRGYRRFYLFGICSGADVAFHASRCCPEVVGMVWVDGFVYPTWRSRLLYTRQRLARLPALLRPAQLCHSIRVRFNKPQIAEAAGGLLRPIFGQQPQQLEVSRGLEDFLQRGGRLLAFYNYQWRGYLYVGQLADGLFRRAPQAQVCRSGVQELLWMRGSHLIAEAELQQALLHQLIDWLEAN